ncbi:MAG: LamG domain-containing protein [Planctomycetes bacterium]|nr:LamG domain-containing protein [Planctomycetota bacterium]
MTGKLIVVSKWSRWGAVAAAVIPAHVLCNRSIADDAQGNNGVAARIDADSAEATTGESPAPEAEVIAEKAGEPDAEKEYAAELELASRLLAAQKVVAELKRRDLIEEGTGDEVRPKFVEALKQYEQLREDVLRRRAARAAEQPLKFDGKNYELLFNGVTSYVELPTLKYGGTVCTIEAIVSPMPIRGPRVNPETHVYAHYMAIVADTEFGGVELALGPDRLSIDLRSENRGYVQAVKECLPFVEPRMHVAAVIEEDEIRLYKDGKPIASEPFEGPVGLSPFTMRIGCSPHRVTESHEMFCGRIDEVRISNAARYDGDYEPQSQLAVDDETVALYHFDEGQGDELRDASGNRHHGIIHDAHWVRVGE